jgi:hemolysin activation/secretion protein
MLYKKICLCFILVNVFLFSALSFSQPEYLGIEPAEPEKTTTSWMELIQRPKMDVPDDKTTFRVNRVLISGVTVFPMTLLKSITAEYENRDATLAKLYEMTRKITNLYQEKGYFLAETVIPQQDIKDGEIEIYVLEGKPGKVEITGNRYYRTRSMHKEVEIDGEVRVCGYFSPLYSEKAIRYQTLERIMLLLNDNPKLKAEVVLRPSEYIGATDLIINVEDARPITGYLDYNNFGSEYASEHRAGFNINLGNLTGNRDILSLRGILGVFSSEELYFGKIGYSFPLNPYGTRMDISYNRAEYEIGQEFAILDMKGNIEIYNVLLKHPKIRSNKSNLSFFTSFDHKRLSNLVFGDIEVSRDILSVFAIGLDYDRFDNTGKNMVSFKVERGIPDFIESLAAVDPTASRAAAQTGGEFTKFYLDLSRVQKIGPLGYLVLAGKGQWTDDNLVAPEQFSLGGPDSVRGYPVGEYLGDYGYTAGVEIRMPVLRRVWQEKVQLVSFYDYGKNYLNTVLPGEEDKQSIGGAGVGLRLSLPWSIYARVDCGWPVHGPLEGESPKWYLQLVKFF